MRKANFFSFHGFTRLTFLHPFAYCLGHVNGVNVIGLSLHQTVPQIPAPGLKPPLLHQPSLDFSSLQVSQLQPRRPTTGNVDFLLPLQPELLLPG